MSEHVVIIKTRKAVEEACHPKGMSTHDGLVRIPASHADWLLKRVAALEQELAESMQSNKEFCETVLPQLKELSRYQGAVEADGMKVPNWRESSPELKAAWFEFKSKYTGAGTPCLSSFAAGWNMQKQPPTAQLAERDAEIALLRQQSVGWVQVFDENAALRTKLAECEKEVERWKKMTPTDAIAFRTTSVKEARKQAAQECIEEAVLWIPTASVAKYRRIMALKFGLEG